jgi:pilus assembly protein Flp/PilA
MSDLITTTQETYRNACIATFVTLIGAGRGLVEHAKENRGQTAAEYMGVLLLVAAIITVIIGAGVGKDIADGLSKKIGDIANKEVDCSKIKC